MKKLLFTIIAALLCVTICLPVMAESELPRLIDDADLLSESEEQNLLQKLESISEKQEFDVVVVTVDSLDGYSPMEFADDFYDYSDYGFGASKDGALLLISMEANDWHVTTTGFGITAITDAGLDYMSDQFVPYLSDGDYAEAFETYADLCDDFVQQARSGRPYDVGNMPRGSFNFVTRLITSLIIGFVVALIATSVMRGSLKSIRPQPSAASYVRNGSMKVTEQSDFFLYRQVNRIAKPKNNSGGSSTHKSSSGRSHGGGGGKF